MEPPLERTEMLREVDRDMVELPTAQVESEEPQLLPPPFKAAVRHT